MDPVQKIHREPLRAKSIRHPSGDITLIEVRRPSWIIQVPLPDNNIGIGPCIYHSEKEAQTDANMVGGKIISL